MNLVWCFCVFCHLLLVCFVFCLYVVTIYSGGWVVNILERVFGSLFSPRCPTILHYIIHVFLDHHVNCTYMKKYVHCSSNVLHSKTMKTWTIFFLFPAESWGNRHSHFILPSPRVPIGPDFHGLQGTAVQWWPLSNVLSHNCFEKYLHANNKFEQRESCHVLLGAQQLIIIAKTVVNHCNAITDTNVEIYRSQVTLRTYFGAMTPQASIHKVRYFFIARSSPYLPPRIPIVILSPSFSYALSLIHKRVTL